jgi:hypothetical protein
LQPIVPKGYDINQFPKALDASQLAVREVSATLAKSNESIQETKNLISAQISQYSTFFVAHFGLNVIDEMQAKFFPPGHTVRQGGGTGNTLSIAQEIMAYKDPAPESVGLTLPVVISILNGFLRIPHEQSENQQREAERMRFVEEAIFKLDYRPTRDSIEAGKQLPNFDGPYGRGGLGRKISNHTNTGRFKASATEYKYGYRNPTGSVLRYIWLEKDHRDGFKVIVKPVIDYYQEAYRGTPKDFWIHTSKHRLGVEVDKNFGDDHYVVKVFRVDPVTGAPSGFSYAVARAPITQYQGNPGFLLAKVKKVLFPEMYLISAGVALKTSEREKHYEKQLENAKNMWTGIPDKAKTPISYVIEQKYNYPFKQGAQPPANPSVNVTTTPINGVRFMLQPTGIEDAMRRILDLNHPAGNAIERWVVNDLMQATVVPTPPNRYKYMKYSMDQNQWKQLETRFTKTVEVVYLLMDNPTLHSEGINGTTLTNGLNSPGYLIGKQKLWGDDSWLIDTPTPIYTQYLRDAVKIFNYAGWPQAAPQEIFSAPIDEEQDLNIIINMFNNYMKEVSTVTPGQMYIPESFNGRLTSMISVASAGAQSASQAGLPNYNFAIVSGVSIPYGKAKMIVHRGGQETIKKQRYHKGARTVVTAKAVGGTTAFSMPVITPSPQIIRSSTGVPTTQIGQAQVTMGIGAGVIGIAAALSAYQFLRR